MKPAQLVRRAAGLLERHDVESPVPTAEILLAAVLGTDRTQLYLRSEAISPHQANAFARSLGRRCAGTPLQHLTRTQVFRMLTLTVRPGVFIPRPETEVLVDVVLDALDGMEHPIVVDVGTGTGAIGLAIAYEHPGSAVWATDRSRPAVALARDNADRLGLPLSVVCGDLLDGVAPNLRGRVDAVVSNPPYVAADEYESLPRDVRADPRTALVAEPGGSLRLATSAAGWLRPGGLLAVEIGEAHGSQARAALSTAGFRAIEVLPDLTGRDRVASARWP